MTRMESMPNNHRANVLNGKVQILPHKGIHIVLIPDGEFFIHVVDLPPIGDEQTHQTSTNRQRDIAHIGNEDEEILTFIKR